MGRGYDIDFFGRVPRFCTWVFYFKDYNTTTQISGNKRNFRHFWRLAPQKTENSTFSRKLIKNHKFHVHNITSEKTTESVVI